MSFPITTTVVYVKPHRLTEECAEVGVSMQGMFPSNPGDEPIEHTYPLIGYQLPLPKQTLPDGSVIPACAPLATPGVPTDDEIRDNCMVLARFWVAQYGLPSDESDIELTVAYQGRA